LLGCGEGLRRVEAHAVVHRSEQGVQAAGAVLQQLLDLQQRVVGGIGPAQDLGLEHLQQRDDLARRVGAGGGDLGVVDRSRGHHRGLQLVDGRHQARLVGGGEVGEVPGLRADVVELLRDADDQALDAGGQ